MIDVDVINSNLLDEFSVKNNPLENPEGEFKKDLQALFGLKYIPLDDTLAAIDAETGMGILNAAFFIFTKLDSLSDEECPSVFDLKGYDPEFNFEPPHTISRQHLTQYLKTIRENNGFPDDVIDFENDDKKRISRRAFKNIGFYRPEVEALLGFQLLDSHQIRQLEKTYSTISPFQQKDEEITKIISQLDLPDYQKALLLNHKSLVKVAFEKGIQQGERRAIEKIKELELTIKQLETQHAQLEKQIAQIPPRKYNPTERETHLLIIAALIYTIINTERKINPKKYLWNNNINVLAISNDIATQIGIILADPTAKQKTAEGIRRKVKEAIELSKA